MFTNANPNPPPPRRWWGIDNRYGFWLIVGLLGLFIRPVRILRAFWRARKEFAHLDADEPARARKDETGTDGEDQSP